MTPYVFPDPTAEPYNSDKAECPYCHTTFVKLLRYEDNFVAVYACKTCDTIFKIKVEIPS